MKIKVVREFRDKTTAKQLEKMTKRLVDEIFECDEKLAIERIQGGFAVQYLEPISDNKEKETDDTKQDEEELPVNKASEETTNEIKNKKNK